MNLPNKITISRILLVPIFVIIPYLPIPYANLIALLIFIIAASTDGIDGHIARSRNLVTNFGKFLDPLADKLLVTAALIALVGQEKIPSWVATIIISREFIVTGIRLLAVGEGRVIAASMWGKVKTVTQIIAICLLFLDTYQIANTVLQAIISYSSAIMLIVAVITTLYSCYDYIKKNIDVLKLDDC